MENETLELSTLDRTAELSLHDDFFLKDEFPDEKSCPEKSIDMVPRSKILQYIARCLASVKNYLSGPKIITLFSLLISLGIVILLLLRPAPPAPRTFFVPLFLSKSSFDSPIELGHKLPNPQSIAAREPSSNSPLLLNGCHIPQYILNDSGISNLREIVHENKNLNDGPLFFKPYLEDIQKYFPNSHIGNFEECWYGKLSNSSDFVMFASIRLQWDHVPDQKDYFMRIVNPAGVASYTQQSSGNRRKNLWGEAFDGISADDHKFYCQGFLTSELYFLSFSNHPSCEPLYNLIHAMEI